MSRLRPAGGLRRRSRWMSPALATLAALVVGFAAALPVASAAAAVTAAATGVLSDATLATGTVVGGTPVQGTVTLVAPADTDTVVTLSSTDTTAATVPPSVTVPAGAAGAQFTVTTFVFSGPGEFACINASAGGATSTPCLNINPSPTGPVATSVTFSPSSVGGGSPATGMVHLSATADGNTSLVALVSSDPAVLSVPSEVVPTAGSTTTPFPVTTSQVTTTRTVTVTATVDGGSASGTLTITPSTAPPTSDTVHITRAEWKSGLLRIDATSSNPDAILSVYLTASDSFMFGMTNLGGGTYQAQHEEVFNPEQITVKSNLGGSATATT